MISASSFNKYYNEGKIQSPSTYKSLNLKFSPWYKLTEVKTNQMQLLNEHLSGDLFWLNIYKNILLRRKCKLVDQCSCAQK